MLELFAVYLESLDQNLQIFDNETAANARVEEYKAEGRPVKLQRFTSHMVKSVVKSNGTSAGDPEFWEEMTYDNGDCKLLERFTWHSVNGKMEYAPEYSILF